MSAAGNFGRNPHSGPTQTYLTRICVLTRSQILYSLRSSALRIKTQTIFFGLTLTKQNIFTPYLRAEWGLTGDLLSPSSQTGVALILLCLLTRLAQEMAQWSESIA